MPYSRLSDFDINSTKPLCGEEGLISVGAGVAVGIRRGAPPQVLPIVAVRKHKFYLAASRIIDFGGVKGAGVGRIVYTVGVEGDRLVFLSVTNADFVAVNILDGGQNPLIVKCGPGLGSARAPGSVVGFATKVPAVATLPVVSLGLESIGSTVSVGDFEVLGTRFARLGLVVEELVKRVFNFQKTVRVGVPFPGNLVPLAVIFQSFEQSVGPPVED